MRKLYTIAFFAFMGLWSSAWAQLPYTRTTFTGAYTPIATASGATLTTITGDDGTQTLLPIGFTFTYNGTPYTTVDACANGWISFGAAGANAWTNTNLFTLTTPNNTLAPWWDDLNVGTGSVLYQTQGTAPNQTFTVQWTDVLSYNGSTRTIHFQVILYETTNIIEFRYGTPVGATSSNSESASIGIEGAGGAGLFLDCVSGSAFINQSYMTTDKWPTWHIRLTPGLPPAIPGGTYSVGTSGVFPNLTEAFAALNHAGMSGPITLALTDANYDITSTGGYNWFPALLGPVVGNSSVNTITIQPTGPNPTLTYPGVVSGSGGNQASPTGMGTTLEPLIGIVGTDYVTIRNLNLTSGGGTNLDRGLYVINATGTNGAQNNLFEGISVTLNRTNTSTIGIQQNTLTAATAATGANSNNTYRDLSITNSYNGMYLLGTAAFPDLANQIGTSSPTLFNTIGGTTTNDIGGGISTVQCYGLRAGNQSGVKIFNNQVRNVGGTSTSDGILVELAQGTSEVYMNKVFNIRNNGTASTANVCGMRTNLATTGSHVLRVYNNFVSGITSAYTGAGSATRTIKGIFAQAAGGGVATLTINVDFNSVSIDGSASPNISSTCFEVGTTTGPVINTRNNIFANFTGAQTAPALHLCYHSPSATVLGNTGSISNYNDYWVANATQGFTGQGAATTYATLANWQTGMAGTNANSISCDPGFVNTASDLHANSLCINGVANMTGITWVLNDIDNDVRPGATDLGADEVATCAAASGGTISPSTGTRCANQTYNMTSTGATLGIGISYQWKVSSTPGGPYSNVVGGSGATTTSYTTGPLAAGTYYYVLETTCTFGPVTANSNELTLVVNALPNVAVSPTTGLICNPGGTPITLTASGASTYTWSPTAGLTPTTGSPVSAAPTATTTYTVTGTDGNGCQNTATSTITVSLAISATATATPSSICANGNSVLNATAAFTAPPATCQPTTSCTFPDIITNVTFSTINRTSTCDASAGGGYSYYATPNPTLTAGNSYALSVSTGGDVEGAAVWIDWNQDGIFQHPGEQVLNGFLGTNPATYTAPAVLVPLTAINGATKMRVRCIYNANPNTLADPPCTNTTFGETEDYLVTITGGASPATFTWSPSTFLSSTTGATVNANTVTTTTTYTLTATSAAGCVDTETVTLTVATSATVAPTVVTPTCENTPVVVNANATGGAPISYTWLPSGQTTATQTLTRPAGTYTDTVNVADVCGFTASATLTYTVNAEPVIDGTPGSSAICGPGGSPITLTASGGSTYAWAPAAGLSATTGTTVTATPTTSTFYVITGTDANGCVSTDTVFVGVGGVVTATADVTLDSICPTSNTVLVGDASVPVGAYCQPTYTNGTTFGDYVSLVQLNTLNVASAGAAAPYYTLYPAVGDSTTTLVAGNTYTITLSPGTYTINDLAAWIDYNQNGDLAEAGEKLGEADNVGAMPATTSFTFTVPLTATNGTTRLRVRDVDHPTTNDMDPCAAQSTFGETEDFDITIVGGLDAFSFSWTPNTFLSSTSGDSVDVIGITATTDYVLTATAASGCTGLDTVTVTVFDTIAPTITCPPNDTVVATTCAPAASWTPPTGSDNCAIDTVFANINPGDPLSPGLNTVNYTTIDYLGNIGTCTFTVLVNAAPMDVSISATPGSPVCEGTSVTLSADVTGGVSPFTYGWSSGGGSQTEVFTALSSAVYTVTVTDTCGTVDTASFSLTVDPLPIANFSFTPANPSAGQTVTFTNNSTNATSSTWDFGDASAPNTNTNPTHIYANDGNYTITLVVTNSCGSDTTTQTISIALAVAESFDGGSVAIFPNPNDGQFTLNLSNLGGKEIDVVVTDLRGVAVDQRHISVSGANFDEAMNLSHVTKGIYFVRLSIGEQVFVRKITVQ